MRNAGRDQNRDGLKKKKKKENGAGKACRGDTVAYHGDTQQGLAHMLYQCFINADLFI